MNTNVLLASIALVLATSCTKEELPIAARPGTAKVLSTCPQQTVTWEDLATLGGCGAAYDPNARQQLNAVYKYCYARIRCRQSSNVISGTYVDGVNVETFFPNLFAVTYAQQRQLIDHFIALAEAEAPTCPLTGAPMIVTHLCFENDPLVELYINCYATYACCSNGLPS